MASALCRRWQLHTPLIQAPMAGGATTPTLVASVSQAGGLGFLAAALLPPERLLSEAAVVRRLTDKPFGINLFVQEDPAPSREALEQALEWLAPLHRELGLPAPQIPESFCEPFARQFEALLEAKPAVASFTFGILNRNQLKLLKQAKIDVIGTATNMAEGLAWAELGADAICAQGREAGGHRGTFIGRPQDSLRPTLSLVYELAQNQPLPVIAAGGIMHGRDIAAAMRHGAQACQLGTAFLRCPESGISALWKSELAKAAPGGTRLTRAFSGRHARGLSNRYMELMADKEDLVPAYPVMNALTGPLRAAAAKAELSDFLSLWAGENVAAGRELPAGQLVATLHEEWLAAYR